MEQWRRLAGWVGILVLAVWIRTQHLTDGIIDFDAALRDPTDPAVLNPRYSGPDHLHPNLLGYQVMADTVSLSLLESAL